MYSRISKKVESIAAIIAKINDILQNAINYAQSAAKETTIPIGFDIRYPKFTVVGKWYLESPDVIDKLVNAKKN